LAFTIKSSRGKELAVCKGTATQKTKIRIRVKLKVSIHPIIPLNPIPGIHLIAIGRLIQGREPDVDQMELGLVLDVEGPALGGKEMMSCGSGWVKIGNKSVCRK
jgi:hypothetical protein